MGQQSADLSVFGKLIRTALHHVYVLSVGNQLRGLSMLFNFLQSFGEHGRELITPEVGLRLLELLGQFGSEMEHSTETVTPQQKLLQRTVFKVSS